VLEDKPIPIVPKHVVTTQILQNLDPGGQIPIRADVRSPNAKKPDRSLRNFRAIQPCQTSTIGGPSIAITRFQYLATPTFEKLISFHSALQEANNPATKRWPI
jgi:hypothetical protein